MLWEILLAVILAIGIGTAFNEMRLKRAAHRSETKVAYKKPSSNSKLVNKRHK